MLNHFDIQHSLFYIQTFLFLKKQIGYGEGDHDFFKEKNVE